MFKIINQSGHTAHGLKEYVCDIEQDISNLSIDDTPGSTAFVIASKKTYMLNNQHQWIDITVSFNSNSSGSTSTEFIDYTENFNELKEKVATLITDNTVLKTQINDLTVKSETLTNNITLLLDENNILSNNIISLIEEIQILKNEIEALKNAHNNDDDDYDGGEVIVDGIMNLNKMPIIIDESNNSMIIDASKSEIIGNTLILK